MQKWSTNKLDLYNKNGDRICDAFGCRKHTRLVFIHRGWFCRKHRKQLDEIRMRIKETGNFIVEINARYEELLFRKRQDYGHIHYLNTLIQD